MVTYFGSLDAGVELATISSKLLTCKQDDLMTVDDLRYLMVYEVLDIVGYMSNYVKLNICKSFKDL